MSNIPLDSEQRAALDGKVSSRQVASNTAQVEGMLWNWIQKGLTIQEAFSLYFAIHLNNEARIKELRVKMS
jgi:hypothetical protein